MQNATPIMKVRTHSGKEIDLNNIDPSLIDLEDIAWSLAGQNRFMGHGCEPYYVTDHVLNGHELMVNDGQPLSARLSWLLHDAHEAYTSDIPEPIKQYIRQFSNCLGELQFTLDRKIHFALGLPNLPYFATEIHNYDKACLARERSYLFLNEPARLTRFGTSQTMRSETYLDVVRGCIQDYKIRFNQQQTGHLESVPAMNTVEEVAQWSKDNPDKFLAIPDSHPLWKKLARHDVPSPETHKVPISAG